MLVAEATPRGRRWLVSVLSQGGHDLIESNNWKDILKKASEELPNLIIMEVAIPGVDGLELLEQLKENATTAAIPVIMLSGSSKSESIAMKSGASNYLLKPLAQATVEAAVNVAIRESASNGHTPAPSRDPQPMSEDSYTPSTPEFSEPNYQRSSDPTVLSTGIGVVVRMLRGGIPFGLVTLLDGMAAAGKTVLCQHIAFQALVDGHNVAYFTTDTTADGLANQMSSIGLDASKYIRSNRLQIHEVTRPKPDQDVDLLLRALAQEIEQLPREYGCVIVDSVTNYARPGSGNSILSFFVYCQDLCREDRSAVLVARPYAFDENMLNRLHSLCNCHISLADESLGAKVVKTVNVQKVRNVDVRSDNQVNFEVMDQVGIRIIPGARIRV